jgi:hypothetical protein
MREMSQPATTINAKIHAAVVTRITATISATSASPGPRERFSGAAVLGVVGVRLVCIDGSGDSSSGFQGSTVKISAESGG